MKKISLCLFFLLLTTITSTRLHGQTVTTMGTDFWFSFMKGRIEASMSVTVTGIRACNGVITNPASGWSQSFYVPANSSVTITIDTSKSYNYISNRITGKVLHLTTTDTVSVYASNFLSTSFDATFVLPTPVLRTDYMTQSFRTWKQEFPTEILIVATQDSTVVDINPTASTINRNPGASPFTVTLNAGQAYLMQSMNNADYSGTRIHSQDCKPIAVFNGHVCAHIPVNTGTSCDHLFEQAIPTDYWGNQFVATMSNSHAGDLVKITSLEDYCMVYVNGNLMTSLMSGGSYEYTLTGSHYSSFINTTKPAVVYEYMLSKNIAGPDGDPSMILIPPLEQQLKDVVFVNYNYSTQLTNYHYINVVTRTDNVSNIFLDNQPLANYFLSVAGNQLYSYARVSMTPGSHRLRSTGNSGFIAHAYGVGSIEGYGYAIGFAAIPLQAQLYVNDQMVYNGDTVTVCLNDSLAVYLNQHDNQIEGWYLDGNYFSSDDTLYYSALSAGLHQCAVYMMSGNNCFHQDDTAYCYINVREGGTFTMDTAMCGDTVTLYNRLFDTSGSYLVNITNTGRCDSVINLTLHLYDDVTTHITLTGCDSFVVDGLTYYELDTVPVATYTTINGCDSVVMAILDIRHTVHTEINRFIEEGDTLIWYDGLGYYAEDQHPEYTFAGSNGCDSVVKLNLHVYIPPLPPDEDSSVIWVPNAFTPEGDNNTLFMVKGYDLREVHVYIFSRWGLFLVDFDGKTEAWDGTYKGHKCKEETYVYLIEYTTEHQPEVVNKKIGTVTLLR